MNSVRLRIMWPQPVAALHPFMIGERNVYSGVAGIPTLSVWSLVAWPLRLELINELN